MLTVRFFQITNFREFSREEKKVASKEEKKEANSRIIIPYTSRKNASFFAAVHDGAPVYNDERKIYTRCSCAF